MCSIHCKRMSLLNVESYVFINVFYLVLFCIHVFVDDVIKKKIFLISLYKLPWNVEVLILNSGYTPLSCKWTYMTNCQAPMIPLILQVYSLGSFGCKFRAIKRQIIAWKQKISVVFNTLFSFIMSLHDFSHSKIFSLYFTDYMLNKMK